MAAKGVVALAVMNDLNTGKSTPLSRIKWEGIFMLSLQTILRDRAKYMRARPPDPVTDTDT